MTETSTPATHHGTVLTYDVAAFDFPGVVAGILGVAAGLWPCGMERLLIILAVLVCAAALVAGVAMSARARRAPLRLDSELDEDDADIIIGPIGAPPSPIDRTAQVLDAEQAPRAIEPGRADAPIRRLPDAAR